MSSTLSMSHSGDKSVTYGLEHVIGIENNPSNNQQFYVISSPWKNSSPDELGTLIPTNPILEIRAENLAADPAVEPELKRYVIPQDYADSDGYTACVNAKITFSSETSKWCVQIYRKFIKGFADDTNTLIREVKKLH
jgi:hypothetical protein